VVPDVVDRCRCQIRIDLRRRDPGTRHRSRPVVEAGHSPRPVSSDATTVCNSGSFFPYPSHFCGVLVGLQESAAEPRNRPAPSRFRAGRTGRINRHAIGARAQDSQVARQSTVDFLGQQATRVPAPTPVARSPAATSRTGCGQLDKAALLPAVARPVSLCGRVPVRTRGPFGSWHRLAAGHRCHSPRRRFFSLGRLNSCPMRVCRRTGRQPGNAPG